MELRAYWKIILRRWWIVAIITLVALIASVVLAPASQTSYMATVRVVMSLVPEPPRGSEFTYNGYYALLGGEFLTDDFAEVVKSRAFAEDIKEVLNDPSLDVGTIQGSQATEKTHRVLSIRITHPDRSVAQRIAEGTVKVLETKGPTYFAGLQSSQALVRVIDPPEVVSLTSPARTTLDVALRTALGLFVGLAIVFLLHYLDSAVYEAQEIEALLGVPVLGEIPPEPS